MLRHEHTVQVELPPLPARDWSSESIDLDSMCSAATKFDARCVFDLCSDAVVVFDPATKAILEVNAAACRIYGYSRAELLVVTLERLQRPPYHQASTMSDSTPSGKQNGLVDTHYNSKGQSIAVENQYNPVNYEGRTATILISRILSDLQELSVSECHSRDRANELFEAAIDPLWDWNVRTGEVDFSPSWAQLLGYRNDELKSDYDDWHERLHPEDRERVLASVHACLEGNTEIYEEVYRLRSRTGSWLTVQSRARVTQRDAAGKPLRMIGSLVNVTERVKAEEKLRESEERFRHLVGATRVVPWEADAKSWLMTYVAPQIVELLGYPVEEWLRAKFWQEHLHPEDRESAIDFCVSQTNAGKYHEFEYRFRHAAGHYVWICDHVGVFIDSDGAPAKLAGVFVDVTALHEAKYLIRQREAELARSWRVNTISGLASGLAHEISQPLSAVVNNAELALRVMAGAPGQDLSLEDLLREIVHYGLFAGRIVQRIQEHIRPDLISKSTVDPGELIHGVLKLTRAQFSREGISVSIDLASDLPALRIERIHIEQVVLNLLTNARDAIQSLPKDQRRISISVRRADRLVMFDIGNSGPPISDELCRRVFEPFFSSKRTGLGLGLSISRSLIEAHGGTIWAESTSGKTIFHFTLPMTNKE